MFLNIVQRLADDLQQLERDFGLGRIVKIAAEEGRGDAGFALELVHHAAERRGQADALVGGAHAADEAAQLAYLGFAQILQLAKFFGGGLDVARQKLFHDLQAHLKADEALQRAVVEIGGDALALGFARALRLASG